jgi:hypothetical protein
MARVKTVSAPLYTVHSSYVGAASVSIPCMGVLSASAVASSPFPPLSSLPTIGAGRLVHSIYACARGGTK